MSVGTYQIELEEPQHSLWHLPITSEGRLEWVDTLWRPPSGCRRRVCSSDQSNNANFILDTEERSSSISIDKIVLWESHNSGNHLNSSPPVCDAAGLTFFKLLLVSNPWLKSTPNLSYNLIILVYLLQNYVIQETGCVICYINQYLHFF